MTKDGTALALDSAQLISSMFALLAVPVAITDDRGRVILSNSSFSDIASYALIVERSKLTPEVRHMVGSVLTKAERATSLVQNLLTLAGITAPKRVAVDINAILREAVERRGRRQRLGEFDVTLDLD